jgi:hypothetical protein
MKLAVVCLAVGLAAGSGAAALAASVGQPVPIETRARGAQKVFVAAVQDVQARFAINEFGDQLIVSDLTLLVEETLKGPRERTVVVAVEGGTVGELTLEVSDMPVMQKGQRAVFFVDLTAAGEHRPHGRGQGIVVLDALDRAPDAGSTLADVRRRVQGALR